MNNNEDVTDFHSTNPLLIGAVGIVIGLAIAKFLFPSSEKKKVIDIVQETTQD